MGKAFVYAAKTPTGKKRCVGILLSGKRVLYDFAFQSKLPTIKELEKTISVLSGQREVLEKELHSGKVSAVSYEQQTGRNTQDLNYEKERLEKIKDMTYLGQLDRFVGYQYPPEPKEQAA